MSACLVCIWPANVSQSRLLDPTNSIFDSLKALGLDVSHQEVPAFTADYRSLPSSSVGLVIPRSSEYGDLQRDRDDAGIVHPFTSVCHLLLVLPARGLLSVLTLDFDPSDLADLILVQKAVFDPDVDVVINEQRFSGILPSSQEYATIQPADARIFANLPRLRDDQLEGVRSIAKEFGFRNSENSPDHGPDRMGFPTQLLFLDSRDEFTEGLIQVQPRDAAMPVSADLARLLFKDTDFEYDPAYCDISIPADANAIADFWLATWSTNTVVIGDVRTRIFLGRQVQLSIAASSVACANAYCAAIHDATTAIRSSSASVVLSEGSRSETQSAVVRLAGIKMLLGNVVGDVVTGSAAIGGRPTRAAMRSFVYQTQLDIEEARARRLLEDTIELVGLQKSIFDLDSQAKQLSALADILRGSSAIRLVATIFAAVATSLSVGALWVGALALREDGQDLGSPLGAASLSLAFLSVGALIGASLSIVSGRARSNWMERVPVALLAVVFGLTLLAVLLGEPATQRWALVAGAVLSITSLLLLTLRVRNDDSSRKASGDDH